VKEYQMWVTSSLPSQHNKACMYYKLFFAKCKLTKSYAFLRLNGASDHLRSDKRVNMRNESKVMREILKEVRETNRLINEMIQSFSQLMKRMTPERHSSETIQKGGPVTEITVRTPEKLEEWRSLFEKRGMRVEYYEPFRTNGEEYFAKLWGYLENSKDKTARKESVTELKRDAFLSHEKPS
jgi:hypothetical protein